MARGHKVDEVPEIPLVLDTSLESTKKTSAAKDILASVGAYDDVEKAATSKKVRAGKGKMRNRRYTLSNTDLLRGGSLFYVVVSSNGGEDVLGG
jgi:large subunit ribosomal protein L4e